MSGVPASSALPTSSSSSSAAAQSAANNNSRKRNADDRDSHSSLAAGTDHEEDGTVQTDAANSKRSRNVEGRAVPTGLNPPSLVLHVRSLPSFITDAELLALLTPFGPVAKAFITQHNRQAFVQMENLESAEAIVAHSASPPGFSLRGRQIFVQFSNRKEVVTPANPNVPSNASMREAAQGGWSVPGPQTGDSSNHPNSIILISVTNLRVQVNLDHIAQICKPSGTLLKIITFMKGVVFKALVQFATVEAAVHAKNNLHGKDIFENCCQIAVSFSSLQDLKIAQQGPKARDFQAEALANGTDLLAQSRAAAAFANSAPGVGAGGAPAAAAAAASLAASSAAAAYPGFGAGPYGMNPYAMQHLAAAGPAYAQMANQMAYGGLPGYPTMPGFPGMHPPGAASASSSTAGCVLLVSSLPTSSEIITPDALFSLFGLYGDVLRVKILYNKRDTALIQFYTPTGCSAAIQYLNHAALLDKTLNVSMSKHETISMPKPTAAGETNEEAAALTQDYSNSKAHRYRQKPPNPKNLYSPSQILHVGNIIDGATEEQLRQVFGPHATVQFFRQDPHMAYVKLPTVSEAILTLMKTHSYRLNNRPLRVSFSGKEVAAFDADQASHPSHHGTNSSSTAAPAATNSAEGEPDSKIHDDTNN